MVSVGKKKKKEEAYCDTKWKEAGLENTPQRERRKKKYKNSFMGNKRMRLHD